MGEPHQPIYFIGISLPPALDKQVADLKWQLYGKKAHMLKPLLPHITLLNPPSLKGIMPDELIPRVREIAARYLPMNIALTEIDFFDNEVCYIRAQSQSLYSLQSQLVKLLPPDAQALHYKRPYTPHITLAQTYDPRKLEVDHIRPTAETTLKLPITFTVDSVSCFIRILPREYRPETI